MLMGGGGTEQGEQEAMNNMLPMLLMMMDDNEVDEDGNVVCLWTLTLSSLMTCTNNAPKNDLSPSCCNFGNDLVGL